MSSDLPSHEPPQLAPITAARPRRSTKTGVFAVVLGGIGSLMVLITAAWVAAIWNESAFATAGTAVVVIVVIVALLAVVPGLIALVLALVALRRPGRDRAARWGLALGIVAVAPALLLLGIVLMH